MLIPEPTVVSMNPADVTTLPADHEPLPPFGERPPYGPGESNGEGQGDACRLVEANLAAYVDGELDPDQERAIDHHMVRCPDCCANLAAAQTIDEQLKREWRGDAPLPSSLRMANAVDSIMAALPPTPSATFAPKRVHARQRWNRLSAGLAGLVALVSLMWSSYRVGYAHGRKSIYRTIRTYSPSLDLPGALASQQSPANNPSLRFAGFRQHSGPLRNAL